MIRWLTDVAEARLAWRDLRMIATSAARGPLTERLCAITMRPLHWVGRLVGPAPWVPSPAHSTTGAVAVACR